WRYDSCVGNVSQCLINRAEWSRAHPPTPSPLAERLGRFYWQTVKRLPACYVLCCCAGLAIGAGSLCLFGTIEPDRVKRIFLGVLGPHQIFSPINTKSDGCQSAMLVSK